MNITQVLSSIKLTIVLENKWNNLGREIPTLANNIIKSAFIANDTGRIVSFLFFTSIIELTKSVKQKPYQAPEIIINVTKLSKFLGLKTSAQ